MFHKHLLVYAPHVPVPPLRGQVLAYTARIVIPLLLGLEYAGHDQLCFARCQRRWRIRAAKRDPLEREPDGGAVEVDQPPLLEAVADDGQLFRPNAVGSPEEHDGVEDVVE